MSRKQVQITFLIAIIAISTTTALPKCSPADEDCRERMMHPDFVETPVTWNRAVDGEKTSEYWLQQGKEFVNKKISAQLNTKPAKNVIMFLGDGLGLTTLAAARNLLGGEEKSLSFESFPYTGLSKTYIIDKIVAESSATATAYLCGVKTRQGILGLSGNVNRGDCVGTQDSKNHAPSIAKWAIDAGKWGGIVTTTSILDASPAGAYAHVADRNWVNDAKVEEDCGKNSGVQDIAQQLMYGDVGSKLKFIMGGGRKNFNQARSDGRDLIAEFKNESPKNLYVETREHLMSVSLKDYDRVLGLYHDDHMLYNLETNATTNQPTLAEMTAKAIELLSQNDQGYFIFIEGGRIDHGHHNNKARLALDETIEFSKAVQVAMDITNEEDTLIVVTGDHSHSFTYSGYGYRGNDIFDRVPSTPKDRIPMMALGYANGPSFERFYDTEKHVRRNPLNILTGDAHDMFPSALPVDSETHGGEDVPVFANGPWSHLFSGVYEQNTIPHMMAFAACIGNGLSACNK